MASELLAAPPPKHRSIRSTTTTSTTTTTTTTVTAAANGTTTTTTTVSVSTAGNGTTTTTTTTTSNATATANTTSATATATDTTISSLSQDELREIFIRLPDLPALVRAALTCRSWLGAVRSSPAFRRLFRALHPAPLTGLFLELGGDSNPFFVALRPSDSDVTAALRGGDFFLTSLPHSPTGWTVTDCRDGYILLWNRLHGNNLSVATMNPMTWAVDILPSPCGIAAGSRRDFAIIGSYLQSSDENPWLFRPTPAGTMHSSFFSLCVESLKLELLIEGQYDDDSVYPYIMAWPPSLVADDGSFRHDAEDSH